MKFFATSFSLAIIVGFFSSSAMASVLTDTENDNVDESSVHLDCKLSDMDLAEFASFSRVVIGTEFGDDSPSVTVYDANEKKVSDVEMSDFSDHEALDMRIFELDEYDKNRITNLIVVYKKVRGKITAKGVLTSNGQQNPVVNARDMDCEYFSPLAINR